MSEQVQKFCKIIVQYYNGAEQVLEKNTQHIIFKIIMKDARFE